MKRRTRINYTPEQKAIIWDRYKQHKKSGGESLGGGKTQSSECRCKQGETTHLRHRRACIMGEATLLFHAVPGTGKAGGAGEQQQPALDVIYGRVLNN